MKSERATGSGEDDRQDVLTLQVRAIDPQQITTRITPAGWEQSYDQVRAGPFRGAVDVAMIGQVQVARLCYDNQILARGMPPPGCVTVALVSDVRGRSRWRGHEVKPGFTMVADPSVEIDLLMGERFELWLIAVPEAWAAGSRIDAGQIDGARLPPESRAAILAHVRDGLRISQRAPERFREPAAVRAYERHAASLVQAALSGTGVWAPPGPIAAELEALLRGCHDAPPSVPELAAQLRVSERTLRRASQDAFGISPAQLGKTLRLNAVRRALQSAPPGARVWEIAGRHGFWHMGQLGRDYRRMFGESPRQTQRDVAPRVATGDVGARDLTLTATI